ncbi:MAG: HAMP domain-containing protein [Candidatus Contendobacter sp.]|nr:HAMP domain-containing protein [Candidatus Contendobacter sp.]
MSLQIKVISLVLAIFFAYGALDYAIQRLLVLPSFQVMEHEEARNDLDRVIQAIDREMQYLAVSATDWATWDDTYQFVQDHNTAYREANLKAEALKSLKINFLGILDTTGQLIWGLAYDLHTNAAITLPELPELPGTRWPADHPLVALPGAEAEIRGLLLTTHGPLLIVAKPVLTSNSAGPVRGSVVFGRFLDSAAISAQTQVRFKFAVLDGRPLNPEETAAFHKLIGVREPLTFDDFYLDNQPSDFEKDVAFHTLSNSGKIRLREGANVNRVYRVAPDLFGKPALLLQVETPRTISARGQSAINYALLSLFGAGLVILAGLIVALRRVVLAPLQKLTAYAAAVGQSSNLATFPAEVRRDELGVLAQEFNRMIGRLLETRNTLIQQSYQLGAAEASAQTKAMFFSNMSHDMRTPMNAIIGFSHLCLQADLMPELRNYLIQIDGAAHTLLRLIDDLLDFSKMETGQLHLDPVPFDLETVLTEVEAAVRPLVQSKGLEWITDVDSRLPAQLIGDSLRLRQVLRHLVDNAVKFTAAGTVRLSCAAVGDSDQTGITLRFMVEDTGIGLSIDQQTRLFQPFTQGDSSTTRRFGGVGLGLAISRQLVELMGGRIGVESIPGEGSTFWLVVRFGVATPSTSTSPSSRPGPVSDPHLRVERDESVVTPVPTIDQSALESAVAQLAEKLYTHDFASGEYFRRLCAILTDPTLTPLLDSVAQPLECFQFDLAVAQLRNLAEHLNLKWRDQYGGSDGS